MWENGVKDTKVIFVPNKNGRFKVSWVPTLSIQNRVITKGNTNIQVMSIAALLDVTVMIYQVQLIKEVLTELYTV